MMQLTRSTYYYRTKPQDFDAGLKGKIEAICLEFLGYGYRQVTE